MTTIISEVYDAFKSCGADDNKARAAAEALAEYQKDIQSIQIGLSNIQGELKLLRWIIGFNLAFTVAILWKIF